MAAAAQPGCHGVLVILRTGGTLISGTLPQPRGSAGMHIAGAPCGAGDGWVHVTHADLLPLLKLQVRKELPVASTGSQKIKEHWTAQ